VAILRRLNRTRCKALIFAPQIPGKPGVLVAKIDPFATNQALNFAPQKKLAVVQARSMMLLRLSK
jgi:hypothetical protein